ncbi:hypothetical protein M5689_009637 [Euphorbia peplus]|nr:hypothetical protein M5689_009637 [Euphorbia peplus]
MFTTRSTANTESDALQQSCAVFSAAALDLLKSLWKASHSLQTTKRFSAFHILYSQKYFTSVIKGATEQVYQHLHTDYALHLSEVQDQRSQSVPRLSIRCETFAVGWLMFSTNLSHCKTSKHDTETE